MIHPQLVKLLGQAGLISSCQHLELASPIDHRSARRSYMTMTEVNEGMSFRVMAVLQYLLLKRSFDVLIGELLHEAATPPFCFTVQVSLILCHRLGDTIQASCGTVEEIENPPDTSRFAIDVRHTLDCRCWPAR